MSDWELDDEIEINVAIPSKKNQWDDEDVDDNVKESWEDSDDEKKKETKKPAPVLKKKVPLKQKIAEKQAAEEKKRQEMEAKKANGDIEEVEDEYTRRERLRKLELEADMANATDLFGSVTVSEDMTKKPLEEWNPKTRTEMDAYRKRLVDLITPSAKSVNFGWFIDELLRDIAVPLDHQAVKKISSSLTVIANDKQKAAKEATKKTKGKAKPQLAAAGKVADTNNYDDNYDEYDFM